MKLRPLQGQVLVRMDSQEAVTSGGIHIPEKHQEKATTGTVVAHGIWKQNKLGNLIPFPVRRGDKVVISKRMGRWIHGPNKRLKIVPMEFVLAVLEYAKLNPSPSQAPSNAASNIAALDDST